MRSRKAASRALAIIVLLYTTPVGATNGYFAHGYGSKAKGRGGVSIGLGDDTITAANNPAGFAYLDNRFDVGFEAFVPKRGAQRTGDFEFNERSDRNLFIIPDFGASYRMNREITLAVTLYGNGGLNTDYQQGDSTDCVTNVANNFRGNPVCGSGPAGVNLEQLVIAPTIAWRISDNHAIGLSPLLVYQRFYAQGLDLFGQFGFSRDPDRLTNQGTSMSHGKGYRLGYLGKFGSLSVGVSWSPRIDMSEFDEYAGLFAEQGDFDIPSNYGVGMAWQVSKDLLVAYDVTKVKFSEVPSVGNPSGRASAFCATVLGGSGSCLGDDDGPGFGWRDVTTVKLGLEYRILPRLTLRAGYNKGDNPVQSSDVTFNILAPGVVEKHYTLGMTLALTPDIEMTAHYMRAPNNRVTGPSALGAFSVGNPVETIDMDQYSLGVSFGMKY